MRKITILLGLVLFFGANFCFAEESLTITTYYPSPYGSYNELTTSGNTYLATSSGNVGIGLASPSEKLEVNGNILADNGYALGTGSAGIKVSYGVTSSQWIADHSNVDFVINYSGFSSAPTLLCTPISDSSGGPSADLWVVSKTATQATVRVWNETNGANVSIQWLAIGS